VIQRVQVEIRQQRTQHASYTMDNLRCRTDWMILPLELSV
jgi:hypothetical protein